MNRMKKFTKISIMAVLFCLLLALAAFAAVEEPAAADAAFCDIAGNTYESEIEAMRESGYAIGFTDGSFRPGRSFTRVELAQLLADVLSLEPSADAASDFTDIDVSGAEAIEAVVFAGLMEGRSAQCFEPYDSVLKAELYDALAKAYQTLDITDLTLVMDEELLSWSKDYTVLNAGEAMYGCYSLVQTMELQAEIAAAAEASGEPDAASGEPDAASGEPDAASGEPVNEENNNASGEITDGASGEPTQGEASDEPVNDASDEPDTAAEKPANDSASGEPADSTASAEPTRTESAQSAASPAAESTTPAATTTDTAPQQEAQSAATSAPAAVAEPETKADEIRQDVFEKYFNVRASLVNLLQSAFDALGLS